MHSHEVGRIMQKFPESNFRNLYKKVNGTDGSSMEGGLDWKALGERL